MRVYVPTTLDRLREAWAAGAVPLDDDVVVAEADDEESEYDALMTAADVSADLLGGPGRRVVVVAEVADLTRPAAVRRVVAVHADPADRDAGAGADDDLAWYATQEVGELLA